MITAEEASQLVKKFNDLGIERYRPQIDQIESWIQKAASEGRTEINVQTVTLNPEIREYLEKHGFSIIGDVRNNYLSISWKGVIQDGTFSS